MKKTAEAKAKINAITSKKLRLKIGKQKQKKTKWFSQVFVFWKRKAHVTKNNIQFGLIA